MSAALDGTGVGFGVLTFASNTSALGSAVVGQQGSTVAIFTVTNTGTAGTGPLAVILAGSGAIVQQANYTGRRHDERHLRSEERDRHRVVHDHAGRLVGGRPVFNLRSASPRPHAARA